MAFLVTSRMWSEPLTIVPACAIPRRATSSRPSPITSRKSCSIRLSNMGCIVWMRGMSLQIVATCSSRNVWYSTVVLVSGFVLASASGLITAVPASDLEACRRRPRLARRVGAAVRYKIVTAEIAAETARAGRPPVCVRLRALAG
jgi:hypothetical protein